MTTMLTEGAGRIGRFDQANSPLKRFGAIDINSEPEAFQYCERRFRKVTDFRFTQSEDNLLSSAGATLAGCRISTVFSTGHRISLGEDNNFTLLAPLRGTLTVQCGKIERTARPGDLLAVGSAARSTRLSEGYLGLLVSMPGERLISDLRSLCPRGETTGLIEPPTDQDLGYGATLRGFLVYLVDELAQRDTLLNCERAANSAVTLLHDYIVQYHLGAQRGSAGANHRAPASPRALNRAEEFIRANSHEPIGIIDITTAAGTSARTLQIAFQRHRGTTPTAALQRFRIERARERLLAASPDETVTSIAMDCGILHLGRFARAYARLYGEQPSATLKQSSH